MSHEPTWAAWLAAAAVAVAHTHAGAQPAGEPAPAPAAAPAPVAAQPVPEYPRMGKTRELMVGPNTWFRFGIQTQLWVNSQQSATRVMDSDGGYSHDILLRRARVFVTAQLLKNVFALVLFDSPNLGQTTVLPSGDVSKNFAPAVIADAFGELRVLGDAFMIEGGHMVIPFSHNGLQSTNSYLPLDVSNTAAVIAGAATAGVRDIGLQIKGYVIGERLEYRLGVFSGLRQPADGTDPPAHNAPRVTGHLQYQFFDIEKVYIYSGQTFGRKKFLGISAGFDFQQPDGVGGAAATAHKAVSAGVFGSWPLSGAASPTGGDELAFVAEYFRYDGGTAFPAIRKQNDALAEIAYYNKALKTSVFGKFELQKFASDTVGASGIAGNKRWFGGGFKYFVAENNLNFTLAYTRTQYPDADASAVNDTNQLTLQMQAYYH